MRDDIIAVLGNPLFRSARRRAAITELHDLLATAETGDTSGFTVADVCAHYTTFFGTPIHAADQASITAATDACMDRLATTMTVADTFIIAPAMHRAIVAATATLQSGDLNTLTRDTIAWESGFLVFPRRVQIGDSRGWVQVEAITWQVTATSSGEPVLRITSWSYTNTTIATTAKLWPQTIHVPLTDDDTPAPIPYDAFRSGSPQTGWTCEDAIAEAGPDNDYGWVCDSGPEPAIIIAFLLTFLRIAAQPISITARCREQQPGQSGSQKYEQVRVVQLRRFHNTADNINTPHRQINWRHSWVVRMHKVRQWYPSLGRHQIIFRGPYIKGPENAPLLAGEKIHALTR